jgi:hypothetical protein
MKSRRAFAILAFAATLLGMTPAFGRGGETGTLDIVDDDDSTSVDAIHPEYISWYQYIYLFYNLKNDGAALSIPDWESKRAIKKSCGRLFTEDGQHELLPILEDEMY